jgi:hypothetical protein
VLPLWTPRYWRSKEYHVSFDRVYDRSLLKEENYAFQLVPKTKTKNRAAEPFTQNSPSIVVVLLET